MAEPLILHTTCIGTHPGGTGAQARRNAQRAAWPAEGQRRPPGEALALVKENPGITIPEIAEKMGIKQNYLYRVLPSLAADGLVVKDGRGWKQKDAA
jgi:predicted HTH transcriptional regulator